MNKMISNEYSLTSDNPDITFFKSVFKRYHDFEIQSIPIDLNNVNFGQTASVILQDIGDLINKIYIVVTLPSVQIKKNNNCDETYINIALNDYDIASKFLQFNIKCYKSIKEICKAQNININIIKENINSIFKNFDDKPFEQLIDKYINNLYYTFNQLSLKNIVNNFNYIDNNNLLKLCKFAIKRMEKFLQALEDIIEMVKIEHQNNQYYKFAWIKKIGHYIIDTIDISIGGKRIDRHYGHYLEIYHQLNKIGDMDNIYDKMIGNIDELTYYDSNCKPEYQLKIPLRFWFNNSMASSLPICALKNSDVKLDIKFKPLKNICICETNISDLNLQAFLYIDYIFLSESEKNKLKNYKQEYIIEQLQFVEENINKISYMSCDMNQFVNLSKEIIWSVNNNHQIVDNIIFNCDVTVYDKNRVIKIDENYFNYVNPYYHHPSIPYSGIYSYSFALFPDQYQPSGAINFSRLSNKKLNLNLNVDLIKKYNTLKLYVYNKSINVLICSDGIGKLLFSF